MAGAPSPEAAALIPQALAALGLSWGFVVHGFDGLDEITTTGPTLAFEIRDGSVTRRDFTPGDFGVPRARIEDLRGGVRDVNCEIARSILSGAAGAQRDTVLVNAAAVLVAAGMAHNLRESVALPAESIDSGTAHGKLRALALLAALP